MRDIYHSNRLATELCRYWIRNKTEAKTTPEEWVANNQPSGEFEAYEYSPRYNQNNQIANKWMFERNGITLKSEDDIPFLTKNCLVEYDGEVWIIDNVQKILHKEENYYDREKHYAYIITLRN